MIDVSSSYPFTPICRRCEAGNGCGLDPINLLVTGITNGGAGDSISPPICATVRNIYYSRQVSAFFSKIGAFENYGCADGSQHVAFQPTLPSATAPSNQLVAMWGGAYGQLTETLEDDGPGHDDFEYNYFLKGLQGVPSTSRSDESNDFWICFPNTTIPSWANIGPCTPEASTYTAALNYTDPGLGNFTATYTIDLTEDFNFNDYFASIDNFDTTLTAAVFGNLPFNFPPPYADIVGTIFFDDISIGLAYLGGKNPLNGGISIASPPFHVPTGASGKPQTPCVSGGCFPSPFSFRAYVQNQPVVQSLHTQITLTRDCTYSLVTFILMPQLNPPSSFSPNIYGILDTPSLYGPGQTPYPGCVVKQGLAGDVIDLPPPAIWDGTHTNTLPDSLYAGAILPPPKTNYPLGRLTCFVMFCDCSK